MAIEVFNRYEKKYIIDEDTFHKLTYQIADYMNRMRITEMVRRTESATYIMILRMISL